MDQLSCLPSTWVMGAAASSCGVTSSRPPGSRRRPGFPGAEFLAWSVVHGLAMLVIDGPLRSVVGPQMQQVGQRLLDMVEKGL